MAFKPSIAIIIISICLFPFKGYGTAQKNILLLKNQSQPIPAKYISVLLDEKGSISIHYIAAEKSRWSTDIQTTCQNFKSYKKIVCWFRISIHNTVETSKWVWQDNISRINRQVELFHNKNGVWQQIKSNRKFNKAFFINLNTGVGKTFYVRVLDYGYHSDFTLISLEKYIHDTIKTHVLHGMFIGVFILTAIYYLLLYYSLKKSAYLYLVCFILLSCLWLMTLNGLFFEWLPIFNKSSYISNMPFVLVSFSIISFCLFSSRILKLANYFPGGFKLLNSLLISLAVLSIVILFWNFLYFELFFFILLLTALISPGIVVLINRKKDYGPAKYIVAAIILLIINVCVFSLSYLGFASLTIFELYQWYFNFEIICEVTNLLAGRNFTFSMVCNIEEAVFLELNFLIVLFLLYLALSKHIQVNRKDSPPALGKELNYQGANIEADQLRQKLEEVGAHYQSLVELSPDSIAVHSEGIILFINKSGLKLVGAENPEQVLGKSVFDFVHTDNYKAAHDRILKMQQQKIVVPPMEQKIKKLDGSIVDVFSTSTYLIYKGKPAILTISRDISEQKRIERLREDTERLIRHDIKNPLSNVITISSSFLSTSRLEVSYEQIEQAFSLIYQSGWKANHLLNQSMGLFQMEEGIFTYNPEKLDLIQMFKKLNYELKPLTSMKSIDLVYRLNKSRIDWSENYLIQGEQDYLESLFSNLIKNALEASPSNETVSVSISEQTSQHIIDIHNLGVIPKAIRPIFFERYVSSGKKRGIGLGTYSAYLITKAHHGDIKFSTSEEEGTHLIVTLPGIVEETGSVR